jgi:hypothetical protein
MNANKLEVLALAISEMNSAFTPTSEAFAFRNPGRLREANGNMRSFSTWAGGLKSLISELTRFTADTQVIVVLSKYGCNSIEKEFVALDYLTQSIKTIVDASSVLSILEKA